MKLVYTLPLLAGLIGVWAVAVTALVCSVLLLLSR